MTAKSFNFPILRATLSGSFHRDTVGLEREYRELARNQCQILSPRRLDFMDSSALFVKHEVESNESVSTIERHHLQAISQSDFLWLYAPKGYVGLSAAMEVGYAYAQKIPIFSSSDIEDATLKEFVTKVPSVFSAIEQLSA